MRTLFILLLLIHFKAPGQSPSFTAKDHLGNRTEYRRINDTLYSFINYFENEKISDGKVIRPILTEPMNDKALFKFSIDLLYGTYKNKQECLMTDTIRTFNRNNLQTLFIADNGRLTERMDYRDGIISERLKWNKNGLLSEVMDTDGKPILISETRPGKSVSIHDVRNHFKETFYKVPERTELISKNQCILEQQGPTYYHLKQMNKSGTYPIGKVRMTLYNYTKTSKVYTNDRLTEIREYSDNKAYGSSVKTDTRTRFRYDKQKRLTQVSESTNGQQNLLIKINIRDSSLHFETSSLKASIKRHHRDCYDIEISHSMDRIINLSLRYLDAKTYCFRQYENKALIRSGKVQMTDSVTPRPDACLTLPDRNQWKFDPLSWIQTVMPPDVDAMIDIHRETGLYSPFGQDVSLWSKRKRFRLSGICAMDDTLFNNDKPITQIRRVDTLGYSIGYKAPDGKTRIFDSRQARIAKDQATCLYGLKGTHDEWLAPPVHNYLTETMDENYHRYFMASDGIYTSVYDQNGQAIAQKLPFLEHWNRNWESTPIIAKRSNPFDSDLFFYQHANSLGLSNILNAHGHPILSFRNNKLRFLNHSSYEALNGLVLLVDSQTQGLAVFTENGQQTHHVFSDGRLANGKLLLKRNGYWEVYSQQLQRLDSNNFDTFYQTPYGLLTENKNESILQLITWPIKGSQSLKGARIERIDSISNLMIIGNGKQKSLCKKDLSHRTAFIYDSIQSIGQPFIQAYTCYRGDSADIYNVLLEKTNTLIGQQVLMFNSMYHGLLINRNKVGLLDRNFNLLTPCEFNEVYRHGDDYALINERDTVFVGLFRLNKIKRTPYAGAAEYSQVYPAVASNREPERRFFDQRGHLAGINTHVEIPYDRFEAGTLRDTQGNLSFINKNGHIIQRFNGLKNLEPNQGSFYFSDSSGKSGVLSMDGKTIVQPEHLFIAYNTKDNLYWYSLDDDTLKPSFERRNCWKVKIPHGKELTDTFELPKEDDGVNGLLVLTTKNKKHGLIDRSLNQLISFNYDFYREYPSWIIFSKPGETILYNKEHPHIDTLKFDYVFPLDSQFIAVKGMQTLILNNRLDIEFTSEKLLSDYPDKLPVDVRESLYDWCELSEEWQEERIISEYSEFCHSDTASFDKRILNPAGVLFAMFLNQWLSDEVARIYPHINRPQIYPISDFETSGYTDWILSMHDGPGSLPLYLSVLRIADSSRSVKGLYTPKSLLLTGLNPDDGHLFGFHNKGLIIQSNSGQFSNYYKIKDQFIYLTLWELIDPDKIQPTAKLIYQKLEDNQVDDFPCTNDQELITSFNGRLLVLEDKILLNYNNLYIPISFKELQNLMRPYWKNALE